MSAQSSSRNPLNGIVGFVVIAAFWTGVNLWRQSSSILSQCEDQMLGEVFCSCFKKEIMSDLGIQSSIPFVGRIFKSDEKWDSAQDKAGSVCLAGES